MEHEHSKDLSYSDYFFAIIQNMKVTMLPGISLDGFIALPNGDSYSWVNQADEARYSASVERAGCILVGNTTFQQYREDFNSRKNVINFVCTNGDKPEDTDTVKYMSGTPKEILDKIKAYNFDELIVCGGGEINGMFASAGLVDEIVVGIQPVVLGEGIPLFGSYKPRLNLELVSVNQDVEGVVQNHYRVIHS